MSEDFSLSPELERIEQDLAARRRAQPSSRLKEQCLRTLRAELRRQEARSRWTFALAVAASVLLGLNLSLSASQATDYGFQRDGRQPSVQRTAAEIRRLLPEVPPQEATRQAVLLRAGAGVVPCPNVPAKRVGRAQKQVRQLCRMDLRVRPRKRDGLGGPSYSDLFKLFVSSPSLLKR